MWVHWVRFHILEWFDSTNGTLDRKDIHLNKTKSNLSDWKSLSTFESKWTHLMCGRSNLSDYSVFRHFGEEVDSFEVKKIWFERFDGSKAYMRAKTLICCELHMTWLIWKFYNPFDTPRAFLNPNGTYLNALEWNHNVWWQEGSFGIWNDMTWSFECSNVDLKDRLVIWSSRGALLIVLIDLGGENHIWGCKLSIWMTSVSHDFSWNEEDLTWGIW